MRGARTEDNPAPHLPAALDQIRGVVVAQRRVADKSNEIPALPELLAPLDPDGALITADAMHTQVNTAEWIISRGAHYLLTVKDNQPGLHQTLKDLPWKDVPTILRPRRLSRAAGAAHPQGRPGPPVGGLPRRRPGDPGSGAPAPSTSAAAVAGRRPLRRPLRWST